MIFFYLLGKTNIGDYMISRYEIRKSNGEEVLYIYLDYNYEFAKLNIKGKKQKLEDMVKEYIKKNKIAFTGTTVALVASGILIGNIFLNPIIYNDIPKVGSRIEERYSSNIILKEELHEETVSKDMAEALKEEVEEIPVKSEEKVIQNKEQIKNNSSRQKQEVVSSKSTESTTSSVLNDYHEESIKQEPIQEEIVDNSIYVTVRRSNGIVLNLKLEEYVTGVVGAEMPASFQKEALKAQAVIARTYALKANSRGVVLTDTNSTQNYKSIEELENMWGRSFDTYYKKIVSAVKETEGSYLTYNGNYIEAVYHSTSNGKTEDSSNVWGNSFPYLVSVDSPYDSLNPSFYGEKFISYDELSSKLNTTINIDTNFNIQGLTVGGRVSSIEVNNIIFSGVEFRNKLGLRSADFTLQKEDSGVRFHTSGYGHGVGMSQYGANGMAKNGSSYLDILSHYYQGTSINHL